MVQVPQWNKCLPHIVALTPFDVTIPPNSQQILPIKQPDCNTNKGLMLRPLYNRNGVGFRVARTVVWVHGRKYCPVWNNSNEPITLKCGTPIATVSTIRDKLELCFLEKSIQKYKNSRNRPDTRERCNNTRERYTNNFRKNTRHSYANDTRHTRC